MKYQNEETKCQKRLHDAIKHITTTDSNQTFDVRRYLIHCVTLILLDCVSIASLSVFFVALLYVLILANTMEH